MPVFIPTGLAWKQCFNGISLTKNKQIVRYKSIMSSYVPNVYQLDSLNHTKAIAEILELYNLRNLVKDKTHLSVSYTLRLLNTDDTPLPILHDNNLLVDSIELPYGPPFDPLVSLSLESHYHNIPISTKTDLDNDVSRKLIDSDEADEEYLIAEFDGVLGIFIKSDG